MQRDLSLSSTNKRTDKILTAWNYLDIWNKWPAKHLIGWPEIPPKCFYCLACIQVIIPMVTPDTSYSSCSPYQLQHIHTTSQRLFSFFFFIRAADKWPHKTWWSPQKRRLLLEPALHVSLLSVCVCHTASSSPLNIICQSLVLMWQVRVNMLSWHWL